MAGAETSSGEMVAQSKQQVGVALVQSYAQDLKSFLGESDFAESKAFLRSLIYLTG